MLLILRGRGALFLFDDDGKILKAAVMTPDPSDGSPGVEITPGQFHTIVSLEEGTIFFEAKDGPYITTTDKDFAAFASEPEEKEAAKAYLRKLKEHLNSKK